MNKAEILRYMRTNSKTTDEKILALVDKAMDTIEQTAVPKTLYRIFDCTVTDDCLIIGDFRFESTRLAQNLKDCSRVVVFGATLGVAVDRVIKVSASTDIADAMARQKSKRCATV